MARDAMLEGSACVPDLLKGVVARSRTDNEAVITLSAGGTTKKVSEKVSPNDKTNADITDIDETTVVAEVVPGLDLAPVKHTELHKGESADLSRKHSDKANMATLRMSHDGDGKASVIDSPEARA